jgi:ERF superfamily
MNKSTDIGKLALALSKAQSEIKGAIKDSTNPFYKSNYADLESVIEAIKKPMVANELSFTQLTKFNDTGFLLIETMIMHSSGEYMSGEYPVICKDMNDPQKVGAAMTYARRFSLASAFGVPQIDNDGEDLKEEPKKESKLPDHAKGPAENTKFQKKVTDAQLKRLFAIQSKSTWTPEHVKAMMKHTWNIESTKDLSMSNYESLIQAIETLSPPTIV